MIACRSCEPTHNRDVRERGCCPCTCHVHYAVLPANRKADAIDLDVAESVRRIRAHHHHLSSVAGIWKPAPMPKEYGR